MHRFELQVFFKVKQHGRELRTQGENKKIFWTIVHIQIVFYYLANC